MLRSRRLLAGSSVIVTALRLIIVYLLALLLQLTFFSEVRVAGVAPELPALVAILAGLFAGPRHGSMVAFWAGLMWDIYLSTPLGLAAAAFAVVAYVLGGITEDLFHDTRIQTMVMVFAGTAATVTAYAVLGEVVGQRGLVDDRLLRVVLIASGLNAVLSLAAAPAMRWAVGSGPARNRARRSEPAASPIRDR
ncbi:MAG: rod shape-determining protein MreD [Acidimicrobiaceae bacterium]|nr:rod shape-determining protein MreD [Acidimicrobiaceae bacterium]